MTSQAINSEWPSKVPIPPPAPSKVRQEKEALSPARPSISVPLSALKEDTSSEVPSHVKSEEADGPSFLDKSPVKREKTAAPFDLPQAASSTGSLLQNEKAEALQLQKEELKRRQEVAADKIQESREALEKYSSTTGTSKKHNSGQASSAIEFRPHPLQQATLPHS